MMLPLMVVPSFITNLSALAVELNNVRRESGVMTEMIFLGSFIILRNDFYSLSYLTTLGVLWCDVKRVLNCTRITDAEIVIEIINQTVEMGE